MTRTYAASFAGSELQDFSEWLPASSYEITEGYKIEYYSNPEDFGPYEMKS
ncbi:MAG: hypothetical protein K6F30_07595 [Lachnospiraceae bacterium]|nr:hypothetical protein [Lachnospiraceae bacterium]